MSAVRRALWQAALGSTMKCFQNSNSRSEKLDAETIFGSDATHPARAAFDVLKALRNKHVLHDENDWMQPIALAIVAAPGHQPVVSDIDCIVMEGTDTAHIGQLGMVVDAALAWVNQEMDKQTEVIRVDLLARDYADLIALPPPAGNTPYTGSVGRPRQGRRMTPQHIWTWPVVLTLCISLFALAVSAVSGSSCSDQAKLARDTNTATVLPIHPCGFRSAPLILGGILTLFCGFDLAECIGFGQPQRCQPPPRAFAIHGATGRAIMSATDWAVALIFGSVTNSPAVFR
jgi:hypothetical protein